MKRYFDIHDQKITAALMIDEGSAASRAPVEAFKEYFKSTDVRELTLSQYRRLSVQYTGNQHFYRYQIPQGMIHTAVNIVGQIAYVTNTF